MAEPIRFQPTPERTEPTAREALEELLEAAHEKGVLRLATNALKAEAPIARILAQGLNSDGARRAVQNLSTLLIELGRVEPAAFYKVAAAIGDAARQLQTDTPRQDTKAPGLSGIYKILHDDELWRGTAPVFDALKAFTGRLREPVDKPISDLTGKPVED
ncbi:DUF1641 domain-containing protein [Oleiagrimonas sp. C23AA]|uniref:DUF1641 domain-containing protein n=1 Tax=Oleiagrimonas sp. C23AA TaxID=2719047 RepID=UPI0014208C20|nr:DUF1641 domain-containing protein [Oleiagrimonas sp. C23AA]NII11213.1 DUF1641 domain-containing protein [Oleiagrimonas sp. C23AA]